MIFWSGILSGSFPGNIKGMGGTGLDLLPMLCTIRGLPSCSCSCVSLSRFVRQNFVFQILGSPVRERSDNSLLGCDTCTLVDKSQYFAEVALSSFKAAEFLYAEYEGSGFLWNDFICWAERYHVKEAEYHKNFVCYCISRSSYIFNLGSNVLTSLCL